MTRRKDTLKKLYLANREDLKSVDKKDPRKYLWKQGITVDAKAKYGLNKAGDLTLQLEDISKSRTVALEKGEAYGGTRFDNRYLRGAGVADVVASLTGKDVEDREANIAEIKAEIEANEGKPVSKRVAFETTSFKNKDGRSLVSLASDTVKATQIDFKEEDKLAEIAKEVREAEAVANAEDAEKTAANDAKTVEADEAEVPY